MIAAFFHDAPLMKYKDENYYSVGFSYNIWERYLNTFDSIIVSTRVRYINSVKSQLKLSSGENVEFIPISKFQRNKDIIFKRTQISNQIRHSLNKADYAIIRLPSFIGQIAYEESIKMKKPFIIEVVGCARDSFWYHSNIGKLIAWSKYFAMRKAVKNSPNTIYVTSEFLQKRYPTSGNSINCSNVNITQLDEGILEKRLKKIANKDNNSTFIIGTTAALDVKYKGQESVIKALGKLKKKGFGNFKYQLVGGGDRSYLSELARKYDVDEQVSFLGVMTNDNVIKWLDSIDIYIQPSKTEGLPRALIEAMSRGLFCLGSNAGGTPELLEEEYIFKKSGNNQEYIYQMLNELSREDLVKQAKTNFKKAKEYDKEKIDKRRNEFLKQITT